jgi:flavin reductase (DIM6/NTAB) family NADH-FMN oxidoreductase RutF
MNEAAKIEGAVPIARLGAVTGEEFRAALTGVPAAVQIVASDGPAGRCGFTSTAFAAVSDDPATVLVSLNRASRQNRIFKGNGVFSVNLLPAGASELADVFAGRRGIDLAERFQYGRWSRLVTGAPILEDALVVLDCRLVDAVEAATHSVIFGEVLAARRSETPASGALFYGDRGYFRL